MWKWNLVDAWELTSNDITEVQTHTLGHGEEDTRYHGGNLFDDLEVHVNTMESDEFDNVAESTRLTLSMAHSLENLEETIQCTECNYRCNSDTLMMHHKKEHNSRDRYQCEKCDYAACIMDDLQMHVNVHHENDSLMVSTIEESVDDIFDMPNRKRKYGQCNRSYAKKLKYRLYD